jgi:hypothetical protein
MTRVEELIRSLPAELRQKVEAYVESLIESQPDSARSGLAVDWRGDLREFREEYDSVQLQHEATQHWGR